MNSYEYLSEYFEELNDDCGYEAWADYLCRTLGAYARGREGIELGCGSGAFTRALHKAGYRVEGTDLSVSMLNKAEELAQKEGLKIPFYRADAVSVRSPKKVDFVLAVNDCYNYIPPQKLKTAFRSAAGLLKKDGVFLFDVSTPYKLRGKVANNISVDDRDAVTYMSFNRLFPDRVEMDVTLFMREADGRYARRDELHVLYIHEEEEILSALEGAGFSVERKEGHLGQRTEESDRENFVCRRK